MTNTKTKSERKNDEKTPETPPVKPWCHRVAQRTAKKFGAPENWPLDPRRVRAQDRRARRKAKADPTMEEILLIAETKLGGFEGRIARAKLRALKLQRHHTAEQMRKKIADRLMRLHAERLRKGGA